MRSGSRLIAIGLGFAVLAGCTTTPQKAARLQLNNARIRLSQTPLRLGAGSSGVRVTAVRLFTARTGKNAAVAVSVRNQNAKPVSDLPVLVGVNLPKGHRVELNAAAGVSYFRNHLPAIGAGAQLTWVLTLNHRLPAGARPFARVGSPDPSIATTIGSLPALRVSSVKPSGAGTDLTVQNSSGVTQYQLPVYALARRGARWVAAGEATIDELDGGAKSQLRLPLVGNPSGATVSFEAPPTIFK